MSVAYSLHTENVRCAHSMHAYCKIILSMVANRTHITPKYTVRGMKVIHKIRTFLQAVMIKSDS